MNESVSEFSEALLALGKAENASKRALEKAERERAEIIANAVAKAARLREEGARKAEEERDNILLEERKKTDGACAKILAETEKKHSHFVKADFERIAKKMLPFVLQK